MSEKSVSELYHDHVKELERRAEAGDEFSIRSLCAIALVLDGWRPGDPDPVDPDDDPGGGDVIDLSSYRDHFHELQQKADAA